MNREFDPSEIYTNTFITVSYTALFGPCIPYVYLWSIFSLVVFYWSNKYVLLRMSKKPAY